MLREEQREENIRLLCEKVLNESWSKAGKYAKDIAKSLEKKKLNERDILLIKIGARAFIQRVEMEKADSVALFGIDLYNTSPCGMHSKDECPCERKICLMVESEIF